jgi:hypothetical protein
MPAAEPTPPGAGRPSISREDMISTIVDVAGPG